MLQFYLFCIFQQFDCENKFLLWNCVWILNFAFFRFITLEDIVLFIFFIKLQVFFFYLFSQGFSSISLLLFHHFFNKMHFLKDNLWLVHNLLPLCKLEENKWSKCNNSNVHKVAKTASYFWKCPDICYKRHKILKNQFLCTFIPFFLLKYLKLLQQLAFFVETWIVSEQDMALIKSMVSDIIIVLDKHILGKGTWLCGF